MPRCAAVTSASSPRATSRTPGTRCSAPTCATSTGRRRARPARSRPRRWSGEQAELDAIPYFYTDQFELGMEYSGYGPLTRGAEVVYRGDPASPRVHRLLARRRPSRGRHEREHLGRERPGAGADPARAARWTSLVSPTRRSPCRRCDGAEDGSVVGSSTSTAGVAVMAVVNRTPDSFFDKGATFALDRAVARPFRRSTTGRTGSTSGECPSGAVRW